MAYADQVEPSNTPTPAWIACCAAVCLGIIAYTGLGLRTANGSGIADQLFSSLLSAILLAGMLHVPFRRRVTNDVSFIGLAVIYVTLVLTGVVASHRHQVEVRKAATDLSQDLKSVRTSMARGTTPEPIALATPAQGSNGQIALILKGTINRSLAQRRDYEAELAAIGMERLLDGPRLLKDKDMKDSFAILGKARNAMHKYERQGVELLDQLHTDIQNSPLDEANKQAMYTGMERSRAQSLANQAGLWKLEGEALQRLDDIVMLLGTAKGTWGLDKGRFMFKRHDDLVKFNASMARLQEITATQKKMSDAAMQKVETEMGAIGK